MLSPTHQARRLDPGYRLCTGGTAQEEYSTSNISRHVPAKAICRRPWETRLLVQASCGFQLAVCNKRARLCLQPLRRLQLPLSQHTQVEQCIHGSMGGHHPTAAVWSKGSFPAAAAVPGSASATATAGDAAPLDAILCLGCNYERCATGTPRRPKQELSCDGSNRVTAWTTVARGRSAETNARQGLCQQTRTTEVHLYLKDKQPK